MARFSGRVARVLGRAVPTGATPPCCTVETRVITRDLVSDLARLKSAPNGAVVTNAENLQDTQRFGGLSENVLQPAFKAANQEFH